jgi:metallo-beta-lactamase class B
MPGFIRRPWVWVTLAAAASVVIGLGAFWRAAMRNSRATPDEPFRIAGNLYYVGAAGVTSFLLTGPAGDVLIDGGYPETAPAIMASLANIGVDIHDVKILLNTHAHFDHAGGLRALQDASGAELWISERDAEIVASGGAHDPTPGPQRYLGFLGLGRFPPPRIDHRFGDGTIVRLGPIALTAHVTAGHTPGCTSWSFLVRDGNRDLLAVDVCSLTLLPSVSLVDPETYPGIRSDFERSFGTLRSLPADLFLGSHSSWFDVQAKRRTQLDAPDGPNPFIDPQGYRDYIDRAELAFRDALAKQP